MRNALDSWPVGPVFALVSALSKTAQATEKVPWTAVHGPCLSSGEILAPDFWEDSTVRRLGVSPQLVQAQGCLLKLF